MVRAISDATVLRVYIAGPMTGKPLYNFPAFEEATARWRSKGWEVVSPHEITHALWQERYGKDYDPAVDKADWGSEVVQEMISRDLAAVAKCDAIALLPGWEKSKGANLELGVARGLGLMIMTSDGNFLTETKPTNPKDFVGSSKLPLHLWPETATALGCLAFLEGALKYGRSNFRAVGVRASIYVDAVKRHVNKWFEGEDNDTDSGLPHLSHALACLAILVDAQYAGKLNDDRQYPGGYLKALQELTPHVAALKEKYAGRDVEHYTITESV